jgi:FkbM family methyltransferase
MANVILDFPCPTKVGPPFWEEYPAILIYGAGNVGKDVFRVLTERDIPVIGFLDRKAQTGDLWNSVPIFQPDDDRISSEDRKKAGVIIAIHNRDVEIPPIVERLRALGYGRVITLIELYNWVGKELGDRFWLTSRAYYASLEPFISAAFNLWADETSKELYAAIIKFRLTGDYTVLPAPDREHQYFPPDLPAWKTPLRLVDGGAFDGDTLVNLTNAGIPIESVAAFEPDETNFSKLATFVRSNKALKDVALWPCGAFSATKQLRFTAGKGEASMLSSEGDVVVQCVSLDEAIPNFAPTLIKMDIEGAEHDALLGARQTIARYKPGLAISLYHRPGHLWEIPMLLARLCGTGGYKFYLRLHAFSGFDLVLYAIPA